MIAILDTTVKYPDWGTDEATIEYLKPENWQHEPPTCYMCGSRGEERDRSKLGLAPRKRLGDKPDLFHSDCYALYLWGDADLDEIYIKMHAIREELIEALEYLKEELRMTLNYAKGNNLPEYNLQKYKNLIDKLAQKVKDGGPRIRLLFSRCGFGVISYLGLYALG